MKLSKIFVLIFIISFAGCLKQVDEYAVIAFSIGDVKLNDSSLEIGDILKKSDTIITGPKSSCDIKIGESIIRIKEKSKVTFAQLLRKEGIENTEIGLEIGRMLCKPKKLLKSESFIVKTPTAVAGVRGTKFTVETDIKKTTRIKVFDGKVKVIKRVPKLEKSMGALLEKAPPLNEKEKVIVTERDIQEAEKNVNAALKKDSLKGESLVAVKVINEVKDDVIVARKKVRAFNIADFKNERNEIIKVEIKSRDIIRQIAKIVELEKEKPKPDGRLLVTRYEIYFIKNGKVWWEGKVINTPVKKDDRIYIASGDYVFSALLQGPVLWRKNIVNTGKVEIKGDNLLVYTPEGARSLDLVTGEE